MFFCPKLVSNDKVDYSRDYGSVGWGCSIHRLNLCSGVRPPPNNNENPGYDTKQPDPETSVMLELWGMRSISSLPSLLGILWSRVVAPDSVLSMGQIKVNSNYSQLNCLKLTVFTFNCV